MKRISFATSGTIKGQFSTVVHQEDRADFLSNLPYSVYRDFYIEISPSMNNELPHHVKFIGKSTKPERYNSLKDLLYYLDENKFDIIWKDFVGGKAYKINQVGAIEDEWVLDLYKS